MRTLVFAGLLIGCSDVSTSGGGAAFSASVDSETPLPEPGQLTAGEWRDLDHWEFWKDLVDNPESSYDQAPAEWGFATPMRVPVEVSDDGAPVIDAEVRLLNGDGALLWEARTDVLGRAELFAGLFGEAHVGPYEIRARQGEVSSSVTVADADALQPVLVYLDGLEQSREPVYVAPPVDVLFAVDTTGSMGDELLYLQAELLDVMERVASLAPNAQIRLSVNTYRDEGDRYVVCSHPFTANLDEAVAAIRSESAGGGGDWPEAVDAALDDAIFGHDWRDSATARIIFLVGDAPPHNTSAVQAALSEQSPGASMLGIRIIPVAASGVDRSTEFLFRSLGIATGGTYVFLTDHSGIGADHLEPTVGDYEVELLNELLERLVLEAIGRRVRM